MEIGARIKLARNKVGLSQRELAEEVGLSATSISKYERGKTNPRPSTLLKLARALSVGIEYFFREIEVRKLTPAYRKHSRLGKRQQKSMEANIIDRVEKYLTIEDLFPEDMFSESPLPRFAVEEIQDAEKAAQRLREKWSLGTDPIEDLCSRLESRGVKVIALKGPEGFDGFSCWANGTMPVIAFNAKVSGDRQRFSIAHELGHLVLKVQDVDPDEAEKMAHRFAAAFLVPSKAAHEKLGQKRSNLSFGELLLLKEEYGLSMQAWIVRAHDLRIIDESTYSRLFRKLSAKGWRNEEPGIIPSAKPQRLQLLIHQALAEDLITPSYAATLFGDNSQTGSKKHRGDLAVDKALVREYEENPELTAFSDVDLEDFHEKDK